MDILAPRWDGKINNDKGHILYYSESPVASSKMSFLWWIWYFLCCSTSKCEWCHGPRFGEGFRIIRSYDIFGATQLPVLFYVCSSSCYRRVKESSLGFENVPGKRISLNPELMSYTVIYESPFKSHWSLCVESRIAFRAQVLCGRCKRCLMWLLSAILAPDASWWLLGNLGRILT